MIMGMLISIIRAFLSQNSLFLPYPSPGTCLPLVFTLQYQLLLGEKRKLLSEEKIFFCSIPAQQGSLGDKPKIKRSRQEPVGAAEYGAEQFCTHKYHGQHRQHQECQVTSSNTVLWLFTSCSSALWHLLGAYANQSSLSYSGCSQQGKCTSSPLFKGTHIYLYECKFLPRPQTMISNVMMDMTMVRVLRDFNIFWYHI